LVPFYDSCVCTESQGVHDLGDGHWPQVVPSRQCGIGSNPLSKQKLCNAETPEDGYFCKQHTYTIKVLRRRDNPLQDSGQGRDTLPPELRDEWEFVERRVNSSCELTQL